MSKQVERATLAVFEAYTGLVSAAHDASDGGGDTGDGGRIAEDAWEAGSNLDSILWVPTNYNQLHPDVGYARAG